MSACCEFFHHPKPQILFSFPLLSSDVSRTSPTDVFVQAGGATRGPARFGSFVASATWLDRWELPEGPHPNFAIANLTDFLQMSPTINVIRLPSLTQSMNNFDMTKMDVVGEFGDQNLNKYSHDFFKVGAFLTPDPSSTGAPSLSLPLPNATASPESPNTSLPVVHLPPLSNQVTMAVQSSFAKALKTL